MQRAARCRREILDETADWEGASIIAMWNESLLYNDAWSS